MGRRFESRLLLLLSTCQSVLEQQDTEPHIAPDVLVDTLHGFHRNRCMNVCVNVVNVMHYVKRLG